MIFLSIFLNAVRIGAITPFWRDISLIIISFLLITTTIYIYFRLRASTFKRVRKLLETRVEVKTKQLTDQNLELEKLSLVASKTDNAVMIADATGLIEWVNDAFSRMIGPSQHVVGKTVSEIGVYHDIDTVLGEVLSEHKSKIFESNIHTDRHPNIWISSTLTPIFNDDSSLKKLVFVDTDITESKILEKQIKNSLREKEILLKEIHHRVKNNLQIIISLLNLQSDYIKDETTLKAVQEGQARVRSMALVHEKFYQAETLTEIDFKEYTEKLCSFLFQSYKDKSEHIKFKVLSNDHVKLDMDAAMPCGLLINEVVSNSLKYAFPEHEEGEINIEFKKVSEKKIEMTILDNGIGLPDDFDIEKADSLGMQLIIALTSQLDGVLQVSGKGGTKISVTFTYPKN